MNKKLMALAVAGALTAPGLAVAQVGSSPGVTLYGRIDSMIMNNSFTADYANSLNQNNGRSAVKKGDLYQAGNAMGVRGREDLGGGTSFWFQLETGVWNERLDTGTTTGNQWGGRNSAIGFTSGLGDISWGIWDNPYKQIYGVSNLITSSGFSNAGIILGNGDTTGALNNALCTSTVNNGSGVIATTPASPTAANSSVCTTEVTQGNTQWSRRTSDSINYATPVMAGVQVKLQMAMAPYQSPSVSPGSGAILSGLPKAKSNSAGVTWARGPVGVGFGYEVHEGLRPGTAATGVANPQDKAMQVGAKFDFGMGQVGVALEKLDYAQNNNSATAQNGMKVTNTMFNGRLNAGPGAVWAQLTSTPGGKSCVGPVGTTVGITIGSASCGDFGKAKIMSVGYDYILSKRTKFYVAYAKFDNGNGTNYYYIAGPAGNNANGTSSGIQVGTDVTTFGVGAQHSF